jgi:hypothetical protein
MRQYFIFAMLLFVSNVTFAAAIDPLDVPLKVPVEDDIKRVQIVFSNGWVFKFEHPAVAGYGDQNQQPVALDSIPESESLLVFQRTWDHWESPDKVQLEMRIQVIGIDRQVGSLWGAREALTKYLDRAQSKDNTFTSRNAWQMFQETLRVTQIDGREWMRYDVLLGMRRSEEHFVIPVGKYHLLDVVFEVTYDTEMDTSEVLIIDDQFTQPLMQTVVHSYSWGRLLDEIFRI